MEKETLSELGRELLRLSADDQLNRMRKLPEVLSQEFIDVINEMEANSTSQLSDVFNVKYYNGKTKNHTISGYDVTISFLDGVPYIVVLRPNIAVTRDGRKITTKVVGSPFVVARNCEKIYNIAIVHKIPNDGDVKTTVTLHRII